jgi:hypothetical protein
MVAKLRSSRSCVGVHRRQHMRATCGNELWRTPSDAPQPPWQCGVRGSSPLSSDTLSSDTLSSIRGAPALRGDACTVRSVAGGLPRSRGTATETATRLGLLRTVAYFTGRRTPCHLRKWHAGELPWTGRSCLGVKGSQVQILSARQRNCRSEAGSPSSGGPASLGVWLRVWLQEEWREGVWPRGGLAAPDAGGPGRAAKDRCPDRGGRELGRSGAPRGLRLALSVGGSKGQVGTETCRFPLCRYLALPCARRCSRPGSPPDRWER